MEREFRTRINSWIGETLAAGKDDLCFDDLVFALPGVHPNDVAVGLDQLSLNVLKRVKRTESNFKLESRRLPVPHPLDYDWRFTNDSCSLVLRKVNETLLSGGNVVFLAAPTLFRAAQNTALSSRSFLVDASRETVSALGAGNVGHIFVADLLRDDVPLLLGNVVVVDPPWYEEFSAAFLWASSRIVEPGGTVFLSTPPVGTRPGIEAEWSRTIDMASRFGLVLCSVEQCLRYDSPPFERNALKAAGHADVRSEWRCGTLARFERAGIAYTPRPKGVSERPEWVEKSLHGVRFRLRRQVPCPEMRNPMLVPVLTGDILPTVSRRDLRRRQVDVWTSGNRVYACSDTEALAWIVDALETRQRVDRYVESSLGRQLRPDEQESVIETMDQVSRIVSSELEEYLLEWEG